MKKLLLSFLLLFTFVSFSASVYAVESHVVDGRAIEFTAIASDIREDYMYINIELNNQNRSEPFTGFDFTVPTIAGYTNLHYSNPTLGTTAISDYSFIGLYDEDNNLLAMDYLINYYGAGQEDNELLTAPDSALVCPFSKFPGLTEGEIAIVSNVHVVVYVDSAIGGSFEADFANACYATFQFYTGLFDGEEIQVYYYVGSVLYSIKTYYSRSFEELTIPIGEGDVAIGWFTISGDLYTFDGDIKASYLEDVDGVIVMRLFAKVIVDGTEVTDTEPTGEHPGISNFLSIFNGDNDTGYLIIYAVVTVIIIIAFAFLNHGHPVAGFGVGIVHMLFTIIFWIIGIIKIYVIIPMLFVYAIFIFLEVRSIKSSSAEGATQ